MFKNYHKDLIHYLELFREDSNNTYKTLNSVINYLKAVLNEKSATDTTNILQLEKIRDRYEYLEKYIDIAIKYYEEI